MITHAPQENAAMTQRLARGQVAEADLSLAGAAWNSAPGGTGWDPRLDRSGDWRIDVGEVQWIAMGRLSSHLGLEYSSPAAELTRGAA
jgi:hypothetical protein